MPVPDEEGGASELVSLECERLMNVNDAYTMTESSREKKIAAIFAKHGVEVEFIDGTGAP